MKFKKKIDSSFEINITNNAKKTKAYINIQNNNFRFHILIEFHFFHSSET